MMSADFADSVVEVTGHKEIGTGFVLADDLIVTCAHVVGKQDFQATFQFYGRGGEPREATSIPELWSPKGENDIAALRFEGGLPEGVSPLKLGHSDHTDRHHCRALGFPDLKPIKGVRGQGTLAGYVTDGRRRLIQLKSTEITDGFSGAPVLDEVTERVVGMVVWAANKTPDMAFAIPAETLLEQIGARWTSLHLHPDKQLAEYLEAVAASAEYLPFEYGGTHRRQLSQIYVEPQISLVASASGRGRSGDAPEDTSPSTRQTTLGDAVEKHRHVIIEGRPGTGKSLMLSKLALDLANANLRSEITGPIPFRIPAERFAKNIQCSMTELLRAESNRMLGARYLDQELPESLFETLQSKKIKLVVLVDALEEVTLPQDRDAILQTIASRGSGSGFQFVVTSRPLPDMDFTRFAGATHFEVDLFEPYHTERFSHLWFDGSEADPRAFLSKLQKTGLRELSRVPLMLTLAARLFEQRYNSDLPTTRAGLYEAFFRFMLKENPEQEKSADDARSKLAERWNGKFGDAGSNSAIRLFNNKRRLLGDVALSILEGYRGDLVSETQQISRRNGWLSTDISDNERLSRELGRFLRNTGVVAAQGHDHKFIHPTYQEYLAAVSKSSPDHENGDSEDDAEDVYSRWRDVDWREIVLFMLGIRSDRGQDVTNIVRKIRRSPGMGADFMGEALSQGVRVDVQEEAAIVDMLLDHAKSLIRGRPDPFDILGSLMDCSYAKDGLLKLAEDENAPRQARIRAAIELASDEQDDQATVALRSVFGETNGAAIDHVLAATKCRAFGKRDEAKTHLWAVINDGGVNTGIKAEIGRMLADLGEDIDNLVSIFKELQNSTDLSDDSSQPIETVLAELGEMDPIFMVMLQDPSVPIEFKLIAGKQFRIRGKWEAAGLAAISVLNHETATNDEKRRAIRLVADLGDSSLAIDLINDILCYENLSAPLKALAARALADYGDKPGAASALEEVLESATSDEDKIAIAYVIRKIEVFDDEQKKLATDFLDRVSNEGAQSDALRYLAMTSLAATGDSQKHSHVLDILADQETALADRLAIAKTLHAAQFEKDAIAVLEGCLDLADALAIDHKIDVLHLLAELGDAARAAEGLLRIAKDTNVAGFERAKAAFILSKYGRRSESSDCLHGLLSEAALTPNDKYFVAKFLKAIEETRASLEYARRILNSPDADYQGRAWAARILGELGETNEAVANMRGVVDDPANALVAKAWAAWAIGMLGFREEAGQILIRLGEDENATIEERHWAAKGLEELEFFDECESIMRLVDAGSG